MTTVIFDLKIVSPTLDISSLISEANDGEKNSLFKPRIYQRL